MVDIVKTVDYNRIWANSGSVVSISNGKVDTGWIAEKPSHQNFNWWMQKTDTLLAHLNQHGFPYWDATTEYQANKSFVISGSLIYKCISTHTNQTPPNATYWVEWSSLADQTEVNTGTNTNKLVTPATLSGRTATTTRTGLVELATQTEVNNGAANVIPDAAKLRNGFDLVTGEDGAITLPSFMGDLKIVWGTAGVTNEDVCTVTFPDGGFGTEVYFLIAADTNSSPLTNGINSYPVVSYIKSLTQAEFVMKGAVSANQFSYIAIGK